MNRHSFFNILDAVRQGSHLATSTHPTRPKSRARITVIPAGNSSTNSITNSIANSITDGPLLPAVVRLAWPVIAAEAVNTLFQIIDIVWLRDLGADATAAATTSMFALWMVFSLASLISNGVTAHVSRAVGAHDHAHARAAATQALHMAVILGV